MLIVFVISFCNDVSLHETDKILNLKFETIILGEAVLTYMNATNIATFLAEVDW